jgi:predicted MPP superfamily phosphohydrolase
MKMMFPLIIAAYLCGNVYIFVRALQTLSGLPLGWKWVFSLGYWLAALALVLSIFVFRHIEMPEFISQGIFTIGSVWLVFTLYMVLALLATDITRIFLPGIKPYGFGISLGAVIGLLAYGYFNYKHPDINRIDITLEKPLQGKPMKIVAISDVHLGNGTRKPQLKKFVEMINAQEPDLIVIGGDLIDNSLIPLYQQKMAEELNQLKAPMGIYMAPGNHEYISGIEECERFLKDTPIRLLRDTIITLPNGLQIIGRDDRSNRRRTPIADLMKKVDTTRPTLLLDHQPYEVAKKDSLGIDIQFSGHTHRGQVWPMSLLVDNMYEQSYGYRKWSHSHVYVSNGLSLWGPPFRIGTDSDMGLLVIQ